MRFGSVSRNPSLTLRVVINPKVFACFTNQSVETRNFKTRQRGIFPNTASNAKAQSLAHATGWDRRKRATSKLTHRVVISSPR